MKISVPFFFRRKTPFFYLLLDIYRQVRENNQIHFSGSALFRHYLNAGWQTSLPTSQEII
jgi:hypothetical protein